MIQDVEVNRDSLQLDLTQLDQLLSPRTKWVAMTHASNVLGTINPVAEVAQRVHAIGGRLCVDGVASLHIVWSMYKPAALMLCVWFLPKSSGLTIQFYGAISNSYAGSAISTISYRRRRSAHKLQPGNVNFELSYGCAGIRDYLLDVAQFCGDDGIRDNKCKRCSTVSNSTRITC